MPVQIDSRLHCRMCQCTVYAILTLSPHWHMHFIHNSGHFGPSLPFWAPGPPALPGLPMASYATAQKDTCASFFSLDCMYCSWLWCACNLVNMYTSKTPACHIHESLMVLNLLFIMILLIGTIFRRWFANYQDKTCLQSALPECITQRGMSYLVDWSIDIW